MKRIVVCVAAVAMIAVAAPAAADTSGTYGDVQVVNSGPASNPDVFQLTSNTSGAGYAGLYFEFSGPVRLDELTTLSSDYQMTVGTFGGGAPRFSIWDSSNNEAYVYFGDTSDGGTYTDPLAGAYGNTGNYADLGSSVLRVQSNGFGGYNSGYPSITWADFVSHAGGTLVAAVSLDLDAGTFTNLPNGQQMLADNFTVNNDVLQATAPVPEPATWAMMIVGFGAVGASLRRREAKVRIATA